ncbi:MAG TPA: cytochrome c oxidase assembly protein [Acidimicrobiales bacterium]|jgi:cytochrome c oxidase assembly factor CtaG|nr:cytochrome c oxidase assembly protein [Acidimicrobiales bacterium]
MTVVGHPFDWHPHVVWLLAVVALVAGYLWATAAGGRWPSSGRQRGVFVAGAVLLGAAVTWPLGDLAAHWLLVALVLQRLLLMLAVPPLLVLGTPRPLLVRLTRPVPVDAVLRVVVRPIPAVAIVTVVAVATLTTGAVSLAARSSVAQVVLELVVLGAGFVLWAPVLHELPGAPKLSALGRGAYLIVQSIVPSFLSIVWIFARHPLYPAYAHSGKVIGLSPLLDQQLSGFVAKLGTIAVLWTVAFVVMTRADASDTAGKDAEPLIWSDVERELERADRRERRHGWRDLLPPPQDQS